MNFGLSISQYFQELKFEHFGNIIFGINLPDYSKITVKTMLLGLLEVVYYPHINQTLQSATVLRVILCASFAEQTNRQPDTDNLHRDNSQLTIRTTFDLSIQFILHIMVIQM